MLGRSLPPAAGRPIVALGVSVLAALGLAAPALAENAEASVSAFDRTCYANMPDIAAVEAVAAGETWQAVTGKDLEAFRPAVEPQVLKAWTFDLADGRHSLSIAQSAMDAEAKADFPGFAEATNFSCSLVLPAGKTPPGTIAAALEKLLERKPDESFEADPWTVSSWSGATDQLMVFVHHYRPKSGASGGLLSMSVFQKP